MKPTKKEIQSALKVLKHLDKKVGKLSRKAEDDEYTQEMSRGLEVWIEILKSGDPEKWIEDYQAEWEEGH